MKRLFIASAMLTGLAALAACNHNMSSNPVANYPELAHLSVPKEGDGEQRQIQEARFKNQITFEADSSMIFYEGSESTYPIVVKVSGSNVVYDVEKINFPSWAQLIEPTPGDRGVRTFLIKGTPSANVLDKEGKRIYKDVGISIRIKSYGTDPTERSINHKNLLGAPTERTFTVHAMKADKVQQPVIGLIKSLDLDESSSPEKFTVVVTAAGGTPKLEVSEVAGQTCVYNSEKHVTIGAAQPQSDGQTYLFPVTFNPAGVELSSDLKACQKSAIIKTAFALVATDAKNVPSLSVPVNARIKRPVSLDLGVAKKYAFPAGQKTTQSYIVSTRLGTLDFTAEKNVKVLAPASKGNQPKFEKCTVTADKTTATCLISWNPHCQAAETVKVAFQAQSKLNGAAIETIKDYEVELVSELPGTCAPATASAAPAAPATAATTPTAADTAKPKSFREPVFVKPPIKPPAPALPAKVGVKK